jgi:hypothetical protein
MGVEMAQVLAHHLTQDLRRPRVKPDLDDIFAGGHENINNLSKTDDEVESLRAVH